jgi:hypothetical protein
MAKRNKWSVQKTKIFPTPIRDTEFTEILAGLGQLIYDELSSQPDSVKSYDFSSQPVGFEDASQNRKRVVNE